jgi:transcription elongation factor Elf1
LERQDREHIFLCPRCGAETLHYVVGQKNETVGIACSNCHTPSLVKLDMLTYHQLKWEDELRQILTNLEHPFDEN